MKNFSLVMMLFSLFSCTIYKVAESKVNKKMKAAEMQLYTDLIGDVHVEYWDTKTDKPVMLLVHGFGATSKYQWYKQVKLLSKDYRIVMPNLLYFGETRPDSARYEIQDQVNLLKNLVSFLDVDSYHLCGVSYGGLISMELANDNPNLESLVVFDAPVKYMYQEDIDTVTSRFDVGSVEELFVPDSPKGMNKLIDLAYNKTIPISENVFNEFYNDFYSGSLIDKRKLITAMLGSLEEFQQKEYNIKVPTTVLWGDEDRVVPVDRAQLITDHIGDNAQLFIIKKGTHMPNLTRARKFNKILKEAVSKTK